MKGKYMQKQKTTKITLAQVTTIVQKMAKFGLLFTGVVFFVFAFFSGAETYGGGIVGLIYNFPNTLPWLIVLFITYIAWRWELIGGILVFFLGVGTFFFFNVYETKSLFAFFVMSFPFLLLGLLLVATYLIQTKRQ